MMRTSAVLSEGANAPIGTKWGSALMRCLICGYKTAFVAPVDDDGYWWHGEPDCWGCGECCWVVDGFCPEKIEDPR